MLDSVKSLGDAEKINEIKALCDQFKVAPTKHLLLVNIDTQRLHLFESQNFIRSYWISTAANGVGQEVDSGKTPLGLHCIESKIGDGADPFAIFKGRIPTGGIALPDAAERQIVGRILWLQGLQAGFNQGWDSSGKLVDTHDRFVYIHGTNELANIGRPVSKGCVCMNPSDVVELFEQVSEGTLVHIYQA